MHMWLHTTVTQMPVIAGSSSKVRLPEKVWWYWAHSHQRPVSLHDALCLIVAQLAGAPKKKPVPPANPSANSCSEYKQNGQQLFQQQPRV